MKLKPPQTWKTSKCDSSSKCPTFSSLEKYWVTMYNTYISLLLCWKQVVKSFGICEADTPTSKCFSKICMFLKVLFDHKFHTTIIIIIIHKQSFSSPNHFNFHRNFKALQIHFRSLLLLASIVQSLEKYLTQ